MLCCCSPLSAGADWLDAPVLGRSATVLVIITIIINSYYY